MVLWHDIGDTQNDLKFYFFWGKNYLVNLQSIMFTPSILERNNNETIPYSYDIYFASVFVNAT